MVSGRNETISVTSSPSEATVALTCTGGTVKGGVTPVKLVIHRDAGDCVVRLTKDGYHERTVLLEQGVNRAYWLNFATLPLGMYGIIAVNGGFFGEVSDNERNAGAGALVLSGGSWLFDKWTGAAHRHEPSSVDVVLEKDGG